MNQLNLINPETATGKAKELLDAVQAKIGMVPNLMRALANSPAALEVYLGFGALDQGSLPPALREQIALTVAELNNCNYCLAAHSAIGTMVGLSEEQVLDSRRAISSDSRTNTALRFAKVLVEKKGWASEEDLDQVRAAGFSDGDITEMIAHVSKNIFTNYFNHVARVEIDFPAVPELTVA